MRNKPSRSCQRFKGEERRSAFHREAQPPQRAMGKGAVLLGLHQGSRSYAARLASKAKRKPMNRKSDHGWLGRLVAGITMLTTLMAMGVHAQTVNIVGIGAASCAHFNEEIARNPRAERDYLAWAQGFMSGALLRAPKGVDEDLDLLPPAFPLDKQAAFLRAFCAERATQDYSDAVHALYQRLKGAPT
jgi:hypothetical protein